MTSSGLPSGFSSWEAYYDDNAKRVAAVLKLKIPAASPLGAPAFDHVFFDLDNTLFSSDHLEHQRTNPSENASRLLTDLQRCKPYTGLREVIDELRSLGVVIGFVTRSRTAYARATLEQLLPGHSDELVAYEDAPAKPRPDGILKLMQRTQAIATRTVYVGDSGSDVAAANRAGVHSAAALWHYGLRPSDWPLNERAALKGTRLEKSPFAHADLVRAGPAFLLGSPNDLRELVLGQQVENHLPLLEAALATRPAAAGVGWLIPEFKHRGAGKFPLALLAGARYFPRNRDASQHDAHAASVEIARKEHCKLTGEQYDAPQAWIDTLAVRLQGLISDCGVDLITIVPGKPESTDPTRLERLVGRLYAAMNTRAIYLPDLLAFRPGSGSQKTSSGSERENIALFVDPGPSCERIANSKILLIDDVVTSGSTLAASRDVLQNHDAYSVTVFALAITVKNVSEQS